MTGTGLMGRRTSITEHDSKAQRGREGCLREVTQLCVGEPRLEPTMVDSEL